MLKTDGQNRLVFCTDSTIELAELIKGLSEIKFIGKPVFAAEQEDTQNSYEFCVGDAFLSSVTFMGCSPYIELEPPKTLKPNEKADFCFIRVSKSKNENIIYHAEQLSELKTVPRCNQCRKVISNWNEQIQSIESASNSMKLTCPNCAVVLTSKDLDWRKVSGVGNIFVEVLNVYLQEGVPTDPFLQQLKEISSSEWQYFYTSSNIKTKLLDRI